MNILVVSRPNEATAFREQILGSIKPGVSATSVIEREDQLNEFSYSMRNLQWTPKPAPNVILYPFTGLYADKSALPEVAYRLTVVFRTAARDNCTLFILVPPILSEEQAEFVKDQETWLFKSTASSFVLHGVDLEDPRTAGLVMKLADSGMFGRYRILQSGTSISVKPMLMRESLWTPPAVQAVP